MTTFRRYLEALGEAVGTVTERGFLEDMFTNIHDSLPRLVYADFLEDYGEPELAERMRGPVGHHPLVLSWGDWSSNNLYGRTTFENRYIALRSRDSNRVWKLLLEDRDATEEDTENYPWPPLPAMTWTYLVRTRTRPRPAPPHSGRFDPVPDHRLNDEPPPPEGATRVVTYGGDRLVERVVPLRQVPTDVLRAMAVGNRLGLPPGITLWEG